jgi:hypothetical protein
LEQGGESTRSPKGAGVPAVFEIEILLTSLLSYRTYLNCRSDGTGVRIHLIQEIVHALETIVRIFFEASQYDLVKPNRNSKCAL